MSMPFHKYRPYPRVELPTRTWPDRRIERAPRWLSDDLRDGNQALINPMDTQRKRKLFLELVAVGFKEINVGFPSASKADFDFMRTLVDERLIPTDVRVSVLVQCRRDLIERTFESLEGIPTACVHFYNSTSEAQRRVVFRQDRAGITKLATDAAAWCREFEPTLTGTDVLYQYSPESYTGTEPDFSLAICTAVMEVMEPTVERPLILNLPSTVELSTPNLYADMIEDFCNRIPRRETVVISVHPHNDRGAAVATAELGQMAGAERVEGTLFGNGERTGNVDIVTLALNLMQQGVDPKLDLSRIDEIRAVAEECTQLPVHPRHPYVGELVYTAFSGSHQDAIKKGMDALVRSSGTTWDVPYLPIDPADVGRSYEAIIRVNSQSGKGGVAYILQSEYQLDLPRGLQVEFARGVQEIVDERGGELPAPAIWQAFEQEYLTADGRLRLISHQLTSHGDDEDDEVTVRLEIDGQERELTATGNGPISGIVTALNAEFGFGALLHEYEEHAMGAGAGTSAAAYVLLEARGEARWGVGIHPNIVTASLRAVISAADRLLAPARETPTT